MKITIENEWPETAMTERKPMVATVDDGKWDGTISDVIEMFAGLLKAMGWDDKLVNERLGIE